MLGPGSLPWCCLCSMYKLTPPVTPAALGLTLHEAQSLSKKHAKLEAELNGHRPVIEKAVQTGTALAAEKRPNTDEVMVILFRSFCYSIYHSQHSSHSLPSFY